jgi:hypothetical protein
MIETKQRHSILAGPGSSAEREALRLLSADDRKFIRSVEVHCSDSIVHFVSGTEFEIARGVTRRFAGVVSNREEVIGVLDCDVWVVAVEEKGASA